MNYSDLEARLAALDLHSTLDSLRRAVRDEAHALLDVRRGVKTARVVREAEAEAERYYADDVSRALDNPAALTADDVLFLRRKPVAWAIAEKIRRAEDK